jgi:MFS family permease
VPTDRYLALARVPGAAGFFCTSSLGRLGVAMSGMGLLWTVRDASGSFAAAGTVVAAFAIAEAVGAPHVARAMDRYDQSRVLAASALVHAAAAIGLLMAATMDLDLPLLCASAALAGASLPRIGAASAVRWTRVLTDRELLSAAFSLEAVSNDIAFLAGPALVVAIAGLAEPVLGSTVAVVLTAGGAAGLAVQRTSAPAVRRTPLLPRTKRGGRGVWSRAFVAVLGVNTALGALFGSLQVSVTAVAEEYRAAPWGGLLYSTMSAAGLVSGLVFGARRWAWPPHWILRATGLFLVAAAALLWAVDGVARLAAVLALLGAGIAPLLVLSAILTERCVPASELTRALAWSGSSSAAGIAAAAGVAGIVVEATGAAAGFLLTVTAAGLIALASCFARPPEILTGS